MNETKIKYFIERKWIKRSESGIFKIKSLLNSAKINAEIAKELKLDERHSTLIFREMYESIRQLGDALWVKNGYDTQNHEVSIEILKEVNIKDKIKLLSLDRFKAIRHDANYRGYLVSLNQAEEIIDFWNSCSKDIISVIEGKILDQIIEDIQKLLKKEKELSIRQISIKIESELKTVEKALETMSTLGIVIEKKNPNTDRDEWLFSLR